MTTVSQLRKAALALPEVEEGTHFGMVAFSVRGKGFASVTKDGRVQLHLPDAEAVAAQSAHPTGERLVRMGTPIGCRVPLADLRLGNSLQPSSRYLRYGARRGRRAAAGRCHRAHRRR